MCTPDPTVARPKSGTSKCCSICHKNPPLASLTRCRVCLGEQTEHDLRAQELVRSRAKERAAAKAIAEGRTKACRTCGSEKAITEFPLFKRARDGRRRDCQACITRGKSKRQSSLAEEAGAADKRRRANPERRAVNRKCVREWKLRNVDATSAFRQMQRALRKGQIAKPRRCQAKACKHEGNLQAHHADYAKALVAVFLCPKHHRRLHAGERIKLISGLPAELATIPPTLTAAE